MSGVLSGFEPREVLEAFETLTKIPHGSENTWEISNYLVDFARAHGLKCRQDEVGNVVIWKAASPGYEAAPAVMFQGHMDMVAAKTEDSDHDFRKDPLKLRVLGDRVYATNTTLGGDDGIAVAYALALLADESAEHPALECVFTVDEELGMDGAIALDTSDLQAKYLINVDSEEEGVFTVSCAGGIRYNLTLPVTREARAGTLATVSLAGLLGGHSGTDINKGRQNAVKVLAEALGLLLDRVDFGLVDMAGGIVDNAIPSLAKAQILVPDAGDLVGAAAGVEHALQACYGMKEPGLTFTVDMDERANMASLPKKETRRILDFLNRLPNGVQKMSPDLDGLVQTSLNLGIMQMTEAELQVSFSARSSVEEEKMAVGQKLKELVEAQPGGTYARTTGYQGWAYEKESPFRELALDLYREMYGKEPVIEAIHAGLECGIFKAKMPEVEIIAIGPDLFDIHSPQESFSLTSVKRVWEYLRELLRRIH